MALLSFAPTLCRQPLPPLFLPRPAIPFNTSLSRDLFSPPNVPVYRPVRPPHGFQKTPTPHTVGETLFLNPPQESSLFRIYAPLFESSLLAPMSRTSSLDPPGSASFFYHTHSLPPFGSKLSPKKWPGDSVEAWHPVLPSIPRKAHVLTYGLLSTQRRFFPFSRGPLRFFPLLRYAAPSGATPLCFFLSRSGSVPNIVLSPERAPLPFFFRPPPFFVPLIFPPVPPALPEAFTALFFPFPLSSCCRVPACRFSAKPELYVAHTTFF